MSLFVSITYSLYYYVSVICHDVCNGNHSSIILSAHVCFDYPWSSVVPYKLRKIFVFVLLKNVVGMLIMITLNMYIAFHRMAIVSLLFLSMQKQRTSFCFLVSSLIFLKIWSSHWRGVSASGLCLLLDIFEVIVKEVCAWSLLFSMFLVGI